MGRADAVRRLFLSVGLALAALPYASCKPAPAYGAELLSVTTVKAVDGAFWVKLAWRYGPGDGKGAVDSVITSAGHNSAPVQPQEHRFPATVTRDSFQYASVLGVSYAGFACVKAKRRALESDQACKPWTYTEQDVPPPPPILDSATTVIGLIVLPDSVTMLAGASRQFCALLLFADGRKALVGGQRIGPCEAVEAALPPAEQATSAQYAKAGEYRSCAVESDGVKRCVDAAGNVTEVLAVHQVIHS